MKVPRLYLIHPWDSPGYAWFRRNKHMVDESTIYTVLRRRRQELHDDINKVGRAVLTRCLGPSDDRKIQRLQSEIRRINSILNRQPPNGY